MIEIRKRAEPAALKNLRDTAAQAGLTPREAYEKLKNPLKNTVRDSLIHEQGQLCAYCMCRIPRGDAAPGIAPVIIEHYIPRDPDDGRDVGQGLDYQNLLAVCHGNAGPHGTRRLIDLTCDAHRGNSEFKKIDPCKAETLSTITYTTDGKIDAADPEVRYDLIDILNLNCASAPLVAERKAALDTLIDKLGNVEEDLLQEYCEISLTALQEETDPKTPYVGILVWYLKTMIESLSTSAVLKNG